MSDAVELVATLGGEVITYRPSGGSAKQFKAIVHRQPTQVDSVGAVAYTKKRIEIELPRDATNGVLAVKERMDTVEFKFLLSDSEATTFTVLKILSHDSGMVSGDGGMFRLEVSA